MSVHYKFKNVVEYDAVKFDGVYISASDLKAIIAQQKKLANCGVQIMNEETGQIYTDDQMIPKNTNVIITRTPLANSSKRQRLNNSHNNNNNSNNSNSSGNTNGNSANHHHNNHHHNNNHHHHYRNNGNHHHNSQSGGPSSSSSSTQDHQSLLGGGGVGASGSEAFELVSTKNMSEEEKIKQVQNQSTKDFDPSRYARGGGRGGGYRGGRGGGGGHRHPIHEGYKCRKCGIPGHSIYDCRNSLQPKVKKAHGIPRDFLMKADPKDKGALMTPSGEYAVPILDREAYSNPKVEKAPFFEEGISSDDTTPGTR